MIDIWVSDSANASDWKKFINPLTPMSDQDRISPYSVNVIST